MNALTESTIAPFPALQAMSLSFAGIGAFFSAGLTMSSVACGIVAMYAEYPRIFLTGTHMKLSRRKVVAAG